MRGDVRQMNVTVDYDRVEVCGQVVFRPSCVSVTQWLNFWQSLTEKTDDRYGEGYSDGCDAARRQA